MLIPFNKPTSSNGNTFGRIRFEYQKHLGSPAPDPANLRQVGNNFFIRHIGPLIGLNFTLDKMKRQIFQIFHFPSG